MTDINNPPPVERMAYRLEEVAKAIGISKTSVYRLIDRGELRSVKIGHRTLVTKAELDRLLQNGTPKAA